MRVITSIAVSVFKESVRDRVLYNLVLFAVLLMVASYLVGQLTAGQDMKMIMDLGLSATSIFGLFIAVFIGIGLVWKEVDRRSIYSLLVKPITRTQFILGKYVGLLLTLIVNLAVMAAGLYAVLGVMALLAPSSVIAALDVRPLEPRLLLAIGLIFVQLALVTAIALFFSTFSSPMLSAAFTLGLFVVGQFNADLKHFEQVVNSRVAAWFARGLYYALPNLAPFDVKAQVVHGLPIAPGYVLFTLAYAALYIGFVLLAAVLVFRRRDFR